jgi:hypothetical protein
MKIKIVGKINLRKLRDRKKKEKGNVLSWKREESSL